MLRSKFSVESRLTALCLMLLTLLVPHPVGAITTNRWTNSFSGFWRSTTNWSAATLPSTSFDLILITNAGSKSVTMDALTAAGNRSVRGFQVAAPAGFTNTLSVQDISGTAFTASRASVIGNRGVLILSNSTMSMSASLDVANGTFQLTNSTFTTGNTLDISGGSLLLDGSFIDTTSGFVDVRVGRLNGAVGRIAQNGGTLNCYGLRVGDGSGSQGYYFLTNGVLNSLGVVSLGELLNSTGMVQMVSGQFIATNDITKIGNLSQGTWIQTGGSSSFAFLSIADNLGGTFNLLGGSLQVLPRDTNDWFRIGNMDTGNFIMSGGSAVIHSEFHVGDSLGVTGNASLLGGQFFATNDLCAIGRYGSGFMTVSNATAILTNTSVGRHAGADGTLIVESNATVVCLDTLSIARFAGSSGQVVMNHGLLSLTNDEVWIGREGLGQLNVSGGTVKARGLLIGVSEDGITAPEGTANFFGGLTLLSSNCTVGVSGVSTGHVFMTGGDLILTNNSLSATLKLDAGDLSMLQGRIVADQIILTNTGASFGFGGGSIRTRNMTVANGAPFVVGDGVNPAVLLLDGGSYDFANGLVISSGATVTGCGNITGGIVNNGTLSLTNCNPPTVKITNLSRSGNNVNITFSSLSGLNHTLQFKASLNDAAWTSILPATAGTGNSITIADTTATNVSRVYRVSAQ